MLETALVLPVLLTLAFGVIGVSRVLQAHTAVAAVAREAARSGALADTPADAVSRGMARGQEVASGYGLANGSLQLTVDPGPLARGGEVVAQASYDVQLDDLPLMYWAKTHVSATQHEPIDLYRSRWSLVKSP